MSNWFISYPKFKAFNSDGTPLVGGLVYTYSVGTSTEKATYTTIDCTAGTENTNPVVLDGYGECSMFFSSGGYKIVLKDAADAEIWTFDGVYAPTDAGYFALENPSNLNVRQLTSYERIRINETITSNADFDNESCSWMGRFEGVFTFPTWTLAYGAATPLKAGVVNNINETDNTKVECAAGSFFGYSITANSKAPLYVVDANAIKQSPCVTDNLFGCYTANLCSDVDPTHYNNSFGFNANSTDLSIYTGVRGYAAFVSRGPNGWKYPYLAYDTDGTTALFIVDQYGNMYTKGNYTCDGIIYGGDSSGDDLTLQSTSHATKGKIYLGASTYFDEATNQLLMVDGTFGAPSIAFVNDPDTGIYSGGGNLLYFASGGAYAGAIYWSTWICPGYLQIGTAGGQDTYLYRDAANTLALRNGTNAQQFNWYATYTDTSNYEGGYLTAAVGSVTLGARTLGTGTDNIDLALVTAGTGVVQFGTYSAKAAEAFDGYIMIKDALGNTRKIMTCA